MSDISDAVGEIVDVLQAVSGLRRVPDAPPENNDVFPFATVYPDSGSYNHAPPGVMTGLHNINIEIHVSRKDLPRDFTALVALQDAIPDAIYAGFLAGDFSIIQTLENISYTFGPLNYAGVDTLGVIYTLNNIKIQSAVQDES